ncbi:aromatic ring-hydroxylating dioxygenase subunit alpha [Paraburkholderia sediminicola]|uniref:Aromatic ring-hydroxylating dioxygenase subunit alpha n=1 Tax=Paraburkholderia metrosideri TaxID=580937 RepID=A0ABW9DKG5_9BURK
MKALKNGWYVAAWSNEITAAPRKRVILEQSIVFYRTADGSPVALSSTCPHRFAPLDYGKVVEDTIQCPYHGLRFDKTGACVANPDGAGIVPKAARIRSYPLTERYGATWIWMGDTERADVSLIPNYPFMEPGGNWRLVSGYLTVGANYRYIIDNLVDVAHVGILHGDLFNCPAMSKAETVVEREDNAIWAKREALDTPPPGLFDIMWRQSRGDYEGTMHTWADSRWDAPSLISQNTGAALTGMPRETGLETKNCHWVTPETGTSSHYFWVIARNFLLDNDALDNEIRVQSERLFVEQDQWLLEALQATVGDREFWSMKPMLLQGDAGTVTVRRAYDRLLADEEVAANAPSATNA